MVCFENMDITAEYDPLVIDELMLNVLRCHLTY